MSTGKQALELHVEITSQEQMDAIVNFVNPFNYKVYKVKEKFDIHKHFDPLKHWVYVGEVTLKNINWHEYKVNKPGVYCFKWKSDTIGSHPFDKESVYVGESRVDCLKRIKMFESDSRGMKTNHSGKIYRDMIDHNVNSSDLEIWFRPHSADGDYAGVSDEAASKSREAIVLAAHKAFFNVFPLFNVRDTPDYFLVQHYRDKFYEMGLK